MAKYEGRVNHASGNQHIVSAGRNVVVNGKVVSSATPDNDGDGSETDGDRHTRLPRR